MSNVITNLRVKFGADTKQFKQGTNEADQSLKGFTQSGTDVMDRFARMFGVNISGITGSLNDMGQGLTGVSRGLTTTAKSSGILTAAMKLLKIALISTGIGALIVALGSLASYFTKNKQGADKLSEAMDYLKGVFGVVTDLASKIGEAITKAFSDPLGAIKGLGNRIKGIFTDPKGALDSVVQFGKDMNNAGKEAADLRRQLNQLRDEEVRLLEVNAARRAELEQSRLAAREEGASIQERAAAQKRAMELQNAIFDDEIRIAKERARIMAEQQQLSDTSAAEEERELAELRAEINTLEASRNRGLLEMTEYLKTLNRELVKTVENENRLLEIREKDKNAGFAQVAGISIKPIETEPISLAPMTALLKKDTAEIEGVFIDLADVINGAMADITVSFATAFGDMIAGGEGLKGFGNVVMSALGDLAINVGKIAIGTGAAVEGIKASLISLGGLGAIAAGVALVALGSAVKSSLKGAVSGGGGGTYTRPMSFDSTGSATNGTAARTEPIKIEVTGEFVQRGPDLVATINKENNRRSRTT